MESISVDPVCLLASMAAAHCLHAIVSYLATWAAEMGVNLISKKYVKKTYVLPPIYLMPELGIMMNVLFQFRSQKTSSSLVSHCWKYQLIKTHFAVFCT